MAVFYSKRCTSGKELLLWNEVDQSLSAVRRVAFPCCVRSCNALLCVHLVSPMQGRAADDRWHQRYESRLRPDQARKPRAASHRTIASDHRTFHGKDRCTPGTGLRTPCAHLAGADSG